MSLNWASTKARTGRFEEISRLRDELRHIDEQFQDLHVHSEKLRGELTTLESTTRALIRSRLIAGDHFDG